MPDGDKPHPLHALHFAAVMLVALLAILLLSTSRQLPEPATVQPAETQLEAKPPLYVSSFPDTQAALPPGGAQSGAPVVEVSLGAGAVDRCMSCHRFAGRSALPDPRVDSTWQPYEELDAGIPQHESWLVQGEHPGGWLNWHPPRYFGCVSCHGGNGQALSYREAGHLGWQGRKPWDPAMDGRVEMLARCGRCHTGGYTPGAPEVWRGRQLIRQLNCAACHEVSEQISPAKAGPSLARVGDKLSFDVLAEIPVSTTELLGGHNMPLFRTDQKDRALIAKYLASLTSGNSQGPSQGIDLAESDPSNGLELIRQARCANCHVLPRPADVEQTDTLWLLPQGKIGPDLSNITHRHEPEWTAQFLGEPQQWYPETRMPEYPDLTESDRRDIAAWLHTASRQVAAEPDNIPEDPAGQAEQKGLSASDGLAKGRELFVSNGCAGCHDTGDEAVQSRKIGPSLVGIGDKDWDLVPDEARHLDGLYAYFVTKLTDPAIAKTDLMPKFDLDEAEVEAIAIALLAEGDPPAPSYTSGLRQQRDGEDLTEEEMGDEFWGWPLGWQGAGDDDLSLAERSLDPESCATCHRDQYEQWTGSRHARAMGPGVVGQLIDAIADDPGFYYSCMRCHARLPEQLHIRKADGGWEQNPHFRNEMYEAAHGCANCHVRDHQRYSLAEPRQDYLWDSEAVSAHGLTRSAYLEDSNYCRDCHQFETDSAVAAGFPPRENTYREWEEWYARAEEPKTCQQCHMPDGDHSFKGIHDAEYVRKNVTVDCGLEVTDGEVRAWITLENTGGGHHLPTYITPKIYFRGAQNDRDGEIIPDTEDEYMLGRHSATRRRESGSGREWFDHYDTRIPAGDSYTYEYRQSLSNEAESVRLEIFVAPDDFYHKAYGKWLDNSWRSEEGKALLGQALKETRPEVTGYHLLDRILAVSPAQDLE